MLTTFTSTIKALFRTPAMIIWCLVFPLALTTMFMVAFSSLTSDGTLDPVNVAVVEDQAWEDSQFSQVVDQLSQPGENQLLNVTSVSDADAGRALIEDHSVSGMYQVDQTGKPTVTLAPDNYVSSGSAGMSSLRGTILTSIADSYDQNYELIAESIKNNPLMLTKSGVIDSALQVSVGVERFSPTRSVPDQTVRYYYALLAMVTLLAGSQSASMAICWLQPNASALGARRCVAGTSHARQLLGMILGSWVVATLCSFVTFAFIRFVVGIDFGGREALCLIGLAAATLCSTALGALVGALPIKGGPDIRSGLLIVVSMGLSMFAGLFGQFSMSLADSVAQACPVEAWINPARLISDVFYSLYYYDSLVPFALRALTCVGLAAAMFAVAAIFLRRVRYEHL